MKGDINSHKYLNDIGDKTHEEIDAFILSKNQPNGLAGLDAEGKLNPNSIPSIAITDTFVVANQAAMLALTVQRGDVCIRSDENKTYILQTEPASIVSNWVELETPIDAVSSVFGRAGNITSQAGDYNFDQISETDNSKNFTVAEKTKLANIASNATANQADSFLLNRANHTGQQSIDTIENLLSRLNSLLVGSVGACIGYIAGQFYDQALTATAHTTLAGVANRMDLVPFIPARDLTIDQVGVNVTTGVASALAKIVCYDSDGNNRPNSLLFETGNLDCATTGFKSASVSQIFFAGRLYWLGVRSSSTATISAIPLGSMLSLGLSANNATNCFSILRQTQTFANAAPNPYVFNNADRTSNAAGVSVRFRAV